MALCLAIFFESLVRSLHWVHHRGKQPLSCLHGSKFWQSFGDWPLICTHMDAANLVRTATEDGEMHADEREIFHHDNGGSRTWHCRTNGVSWKLSLPLPQEFEQYQILSLSILSGDNWYKPHLAFSFLFECFWGWPLIAHTLMQQTLTG